MSFVSLFFNISHLISNSPLQVRKLAELMLGHTLVTKQTGPQGKLVNKILVCKRHFLRRETYIAMLLDRQFQGPVLIYSDKGGMDIEKVAHDSPSSIHKEAIDLEKGKNQFATYVNFC
jgi:succinyl-CoA synthetase beta subunit